MSSLVIGTRGSDLALTQARMVQAALARRHPDLTCETRIVKTVGDRHQDLELTGFSAQKIVDKGIFTKDLEVALLTGDIDVAVHSLKDVPTASEAGLTIAAVLPRADTRDALLTKAALESLMTVERGARLATSSVRRRAQLLWKRPDLLVRDIRGNVPTRLRKLVEGDSLDGILLAVAGLERLGYLRRQAKSFLFEGRAIHITPLGPPDFLPACGQGAVALQTRADDPETPALVHAINHAATFTRIAAERMILARLQAGCHTPVGVDTHLKHDQLGIHLRVFDEDQLSAPPREARVSGSASDLVGLIDQLMDSLNDYER